MKNKTRKIVKKSLFERIGLVRLGGERLSLKSVRFHTSIDNEEKEANLKEKNYL